MLPTCRALVLPAWIEHQPRLALLALASGIPVVASRDCGLPDHSLLHLMDSPDPIALAEKRRNALSPVAATDSHPSVQPEAKSRLIEAVFQSVASI